MLTDAAATQEHAQSYASALEPIRALMQQSPWGDDDLTASFLQEYYQAITLAIEAHGLMAEKWAEVGLGIGDMATTTAIADDAATTFVTWSADADERTPRTESAQWT
jgi:hypothetical protein